MQTAYVPSAAGGVGEYDPGRTGRTGTGTDKRGLEGRIDASQPYVFQTDE